MIKKLWNLFVIMAFMCCPLGFAHAGGETENLSPDDMALVQQVFNQCSSSPNIMSYNCDCVAIRSLDLKKELLNRLDRQGADDLIKKYYLQNGNRKMMQQAYSRCVNVDRVAVNTYARCIDSNIAMREDYREFCSCFSARYSDIYAKRGTNPSNDLADLMTEAMKQCESNE